MSNNTIPYQMQGYQIAIASQQQSFTPQQAQLISTMNSIYTLSCQAELHLLIGMIGSKQELSLNEFKWADKKSQLPNMNQSVQRGVFEECFKIKRKNKHLLNIMLNLREALVRKMYESSAQDTLIERQYRSVLQSINFAKENIKAKLDKLKQMHQAKGIPHESKGLDQNMLTTLKSGSIVIMKESIELKQEINLFLNYCENSKND